MDERHPAPDVLARRLRGVLAAAEERELGEHLAACPLCRRALAALAADGRTGGDLLGYEVALERAAQRAGERWRELVTEADDATALAAELLEHPGERRLAVVDEPRFRALKLCELLQDMAREASSNEPGRAIEIAELAVEVAGRLDPAHYGVNLVEDARARSWARLGNACRVASDLRRAEEALRTAEEHQRQDIQDPMTRAEILSLTASLRTSQGRFDEAVRLLDRALAIYREAKDRHLEGKALIQKGTALGHAGKLGQAIRLLRQGLSRIDLAEEPGLLVAARHNLIVYLNESGFHRKAFEALEQTRRIYRDVGNRMHLVRLRWLEGRISCDLGRFADAEAALCEAREAFVEQGIGFDAALVSLDLAAAYARQGKAAEVKRLAAEMIPIFKSRDVHEEALAALLIFERAAESEEVTVELLDRIATSLRGARKNPELRFEDGG